MARGGTDVRTGAQRMRALDALRFVAALAVVAFHYTGRDSGAWGDSVRTVFPSLSRFTVYGGFGPYLFFIISGFVVLMSAQGRSAAQFIASRVGRLYPAYWVGVLLTGAVVQLWPIVPAWRDLTGTDVAVNLSMFQSAFGVRDVDGVYWTLWVELKFYLLLLVLVGLGITRARLLALCFAWPLLGALALQTGSPLLTALLEPHYAPFFCLGILLYLVHQHGWNAPTGLLLGLNYVAALWVSATYYVQWSIDVAGHPVSVRGLAVLLTGCIAAVVVVTLTPVARVDWRWLTVLGALTYPLYLVHQDIGWVVLHGLSKYVPAHLAVPLVVLGMLCLAYAVHRCVERPLGRRLRRAVERELEQLRVPAAGRHVPAPRHPAAQPAAGPPAPPRHPVRPARDLPPAPRPAGVPPEAAPVSGRQPG
ncbi:acyltransferase [Modestobacter sp. NPDC049651]|uniref:acyltransferase family protein n=1 Tax=unclassified Modestobacter TaxID=2643866 RepID=UPI0033DE31A7